MNLKMPMIIVAGAQDKLIDTDQQSALLHSEVPQSTFCRIPGSGHMVQQTATDQVISAVRDLANCLAERRSGGTDPTSHGGHWTAFSPLISTCDE